MLWHFPDSIALFWFNSFFCTLLTTACKFSTKHSYPKGHNVWSTSALKCSFCLTCILDLTDFGGCFCSSDPEQPFVTPHYSTPYILGIYRHETSLTIPCRTSSPDTVVTLRGVSPCKMNQLIKLFYCHVYIYYTMNIVYVFRRPC